jgi:lipopolysaccharide export LptBFGC system permease protein LptF
MPWTIYRYILLDVIRLLLMATMVLVVIIALAVTVQELQEGLLGPLGLVKFIAYTMPTTIGFALPFAASFASTLVFTRLVADNEITACRASGISYRSLLLPLLFLGLVMTLSLFHLSNWIIPTFYKAAQRMVEQDVIQVLVTQLSKGRPFKRQNMVLYADGVRDGPPPEGLAAGMDIEPQRLISLQGVAVGQLDDEGKLRSDTTAERADVLVYRARGQTWVKIHLLNTLYFDATGDRNGAYSQSLHLQEIALPNPLRNRTEFLSWPELRDLERQPEQYDSVAKARGQLVTAIAQERILARAAGELASRAGKGLTLLGLGSSEYYVIRPHLAERRGDALRLTGSASQPVVIDYFAQGQAVYHYEAELATIDVDSSGPEPRVRVELRVATVRDARLADRRTQRQSLRLPWMRWPTPVQQDLVQMSTPALRQFALEQHRHDKALQKPVTVLNKAISRLGLRVTAQLHQRAASAVACTFVLLLGALLSLKLQGRMPLVVYFWSFLMAAGAVIIIQGGGQIVTDGSLAAGLAVLWAGNLLLLSVCSVVYFKLARN